MAEQSDSSEQVQCLYVSHRWLLNLWIYKSYAIKYYKCTIAVFLTQGHIVVFITQL